MKLNALLVLGVFAGFLDSATRAPTPSIAYDVSVDPARSDEISVTMHVRNAPASRIHLAMKAHPEYDARFWRYLQMSYPMAERRDSSLWDATLPDGDGDIRYTVHLPTDEGELRASWRCVVRRDGALLNPPDVFLYIPELAESSVAVTVHAPASWRIATALARGESPRTFVAPNSATLLDSPLMLGHLREWRFTEAGTRFTVAYWPLPEAQAFDTLMFVTQLHKLVHAALGIFRSAPESTYWFLLQDGAGDALEHRASVTVGVPSAELAKNTRARLPEIAHEFFHAWNLVSIQPDSFGDLRYDATPPTTLLWLGEGGTLRYADVLLRRAGLADSSDSRVAHLESLLARYYAVRWARRVSPEDASMAFGHSPLSDSAATGGFYLQGELLVEALDAAIRDSTHERRSFDDVLRTLFERSRTRPRFTGRDIERAINTVCGCNLSGVFRREIQAPGFIDLREAANRLGWRVVVDTAPATDSRGQPLPDLRLSGAETKQGTIALVLTYASSIWARAGLRTGDVVESMNGVPIRRSGDVYSFLRSTHLGDTVDVMRARRGVTDQVAVVVRGYDRPRVRLTDVAAPTSAQRSRRARWMKGG